MGGHPTEIMINWALSRSA